MKLILLLLATLVLLVALAWLIGALLPRDHTASRAVVIRQPASVLFDTARGRSAAPPRD